ncbi:MAG: site-specific DNA-methyltransferase [Pseudoxanthomonas sp.]|nr:site-specific DNA-methyltransferase [Pseudoxanthomonas sp.]
MSGRYDHLDRDALVRILERRDSERQLGLVWERPEAEGGELEADASVNADFVALELDPALSHGDAPWRDLIIEGDNHDALRYLRMTHAGRIRCIYIDPPYNTGNRDFVYNDRFVDRSHRFRHSLWLEFMHRRLRLARELLAEDGVIFVSIDDNELFRLGMLMDQVFGSDSRLATLIWQTDGNFDNQAKIKVCHEYVLAYSRNPSAFPMPPVVDPNIGESSKLFRPTIRNTIVKNGPKNPVSDLVLPAGFPADFECGRVPARSNKWPHILTDIEVMNYRLMDSVTVRSGWANRELCVEFCAKGFSPVMDSKGQETTFVLTANGTIENVKVRDRPSHVVSILRNLGNTQSDGAMLADMGVGFSYPKPVTLMQYVISLLDDKQVTVLDFFAGSGTTAHAVAKLNAEDGGQRRYILVSNTEATDDQPDKNLCRDVCAERVRRVLGGYTNAKGEPVAGLGGGFAYLRTRRVPRHRINRRLGHVEIWHALCLIHGQPLQSWDGRGLVHAAVEAAADPLSYLPDLDDTTLAALQAWLASLPRRAAVYCWTPERLAHIDPALATVLPVPQSLAQRFGR